VAMTRDDDIRRTLDEALDGQDLSPSERHQLAIRLRTITGTLPPGSGTMAGLSGRLEAAAAMLHPSAL
jgi:hypothetical protein